MVNPLLERILPQLRQHPGVRAVTLFGSAARGAADAESDIDLQIVASRPHDFLDAGWIETTELPLLAYALRPAFGGSRKATAVFSTGEVDLVIVPATRLFLARSLVALGIHRRSARVRRGLGDLAIVLRPGFRVLYGAAQWEPFFRRVVREIPDPRLDNEAVWYRGACAFADYVSLRRKVARGELVAAQRWLHIHIVDTMLALLHEQRLREGQPSFHDGRRIEHVLPPEQQALVRVEARLAPEELLAAADAALAHTRALVVALTGREPAWTLAPVDRTA